MTAPEWIPINGTLTVTAVMDRYFDFISNITLGPDGAPEFHPCFTTELLRALEIAMNVTLKVIVSKRWGEYTASTDSWNGMIGLLVNGSADVALSPMTVLSARREAVDYNLYTISDKLTAVFLRPRYQPDSLALLKPFRSNTWYTLTAVYIAFAAFMFTFNAFRKTKEHAQCLTDVLLEELRRSVSCEDHIVGIDSGPACSWALYMLCCKGPNSVPAVVSLRMSVFAGSMLGLVLFAAYGGTIISFMTVSVEPFANFGQLLTTSYSIVFSSYYPIVQGVEGSTLRNVRKAYARRSRKSVHGRLEEAKVDVMRGSYVFIDSGWRSYTALQDNFSPRESCWVGNIVFEGVKLNFATAVRKNSALRVRLDYHILQFKQYGLNDLWEKRHIPARPACEMDLDEIPVSIQSIGIAVFLLTTGFLISLGAVVLEELRDRLRK